MDPVWVGGEGGCVVVHSHLGLEEMHLSSDDDDDYDEDDGVIMDSLEQSQRSTAITEEPCPLKGYLQQWFTHLFQGQNDV